MSPTALDLDAYADRPSTWATSMANMGELVVGCLDATGARLVAEVGAYAGDLTRLLVDWAAQSGARVVAIDPSPTEPLLQLDRDHPELELIREISLDALPDLDPPDVVVVDGDHNYYTVAEELRLIGERAVELPLVIFHDACWPHGRRDDYFAADQIPEGHRRPVAGDGGGLHPGEPGLRAGGLPYPWSAAREGGSRNGVLTAAEDFVAGRDDLRLAVVPAFFGLGAIWRRDAPAAEALARLIDPWDDNPLLARLESNRVHQIAEGHARQVEIWKEQARQARQEAVLRRLLDSSAFAVAERLSRLRERAGVAPGESVISKDDIRRALAD